MAGPGQARPLSYRKVQLYTRVELIGLVWQNVARHGGREKKNRSKLYTQPETKEHRLKSKIGILLAQHLVDRQLQ